ncbi:hypothetical protein MKW94_026827 [Papaver nudicaule]|uniref:Uncharacterized protein n=1 Tax=Papaver nudicaule TaxID=74823 RepID=A0AA41W072_PAPNU|nr:hypothetical protein [Papaver nudicaule]
MIILIHKHSTFFEGCSKGQTVEGLNEVKQYLKKFGYAMDVMFPVETQHMNDDVFDYVLESQIQTHQSKFHLEVTGILDAQTVKQMIMPRCGGSDIVYGTTFTRYNDHHPEKRGSIVFDSASDYNFFPDNPPKIRSKTELTCRLSDTTAVNVDTEVLDFVCSRAFAKWAAVTDFNFVRSTNADVAADIQIAFRRSNDIGDAVMDGPGGILACAFAPSDRRIYYDEWMANPWSNMNDLESVAMQTYIICKTGKYFEFNKMFYYCFSLEIPKTP